MKCPNCGLADLERRKVPFVQGGKFLGDFEADVCPICGEILFLEPESERINARAKELGVWGKPVAADWFLLTPTPNEEDRFTVPIVRWLEKTASTRSSVPKSKVLGIRPSASTA